MMPEMVPLFLPCRVSVRFAPAPVAALVWVLKVAALKVSAPLPLFWISAPPVSPTAAVPLLLPI